MRAFEAWLKREIIPKQKYSGGFPFGLTHNRARRQSWRAALDWFYDKLDYGEEHEELKDLIERELEEEE